MTAPVQRRLSSTSRARAERWYRSQGVLFFASSFTLVGVANVDLVDFPVESEPGTVSYNSLANQLSFKSHRALDSVMTASNMGVTYLGLTSDNACPNVGPKRDITLPENKAAQSTRAEPSSHAVRQQVERLCRSAEFAGSPRAVQFLRFVVEQAQAGRADELSQRLLAERVFARGPEFDPSTNPIVRMQAGRVRRALEHYYLTVGKHDPIAIFLSKGTYAPAFEVKTRAESVRGKHGSVSPFLLVTPFCNYSGRGELDFIAQGLGSELAAALDSYQTARVLLLPGNPQEDAGVAEQTQKLCEGAPGFLVKGTLSWRSGSLRVAVRLEDACGGIQHWSYEDHCRTASDDRDIFLDELVKRVAASIAEEQGVIVQQSLPRMEQASPAEANAYEAILHLYNSERSASLESFEKALAALRHAVEISPNDGRLWTGLARMCAINYSMEFLPKAQIPIEETIAYAEKGVRLNTANQRAWCVLSYANTIAGELQSGREAVLTSLAQNPDSLFFRDVVGYLLTLQGDWERGPAIAQEAVRINPFVRPFVFCALWLDAFRQEAFDDAYVWAQRFMNPINFWSPLMTAVSLARLGEQKKAENAVGHLLQLRPDFSENGHRLIRHYVKFEDLACRIEDALKLAGMDLSRTPENQKIT